MCCISLYRALYRDFLRKIVLKKIVIPIFITLYSVYQARIRSNSGAIVSTSNPICRKIAISAIFSQIGKPDKEKSYKMHFFCVFCVFFLRALAYVRKKQYLCIAFQKRVQAFYDILTRARADKVQRCKRLRCLSLPIWSRWGFLPSALVRAYLVAFRSLSHFFSLPVRAAVCCGRVPSSLLAFFRV